MQLRPEKETKQYYSIEASTHVSAIIWGGPFKSIVGLAYSFRHMFAVNLLCSGFLDSSRKVGVAAPLCPLHGGHLLGGRPAGSPVGHTGSPDCFTPNDLPGPWLRSHTHPQGPSRTRAAGPQAAVGSAPVDFLLLREQRKPRHPLPAGAGVAHFHGCMSPGKEKEGPPHSIVLNAGSHSRKRTPCRSPFV